MTRDAELKMVNMAADFARASLESWVEITKLELPGAPEEDLLASLLSALQLMVALSIYGTPITPELFASRVAVTLDSIRAVRIRSGGASS